MDLDSALIFKSKEEIADERATKRGKVVKRWFDSFFEFPENGVDSRTAFRNAIKFHKRLIYFWSPKKEAHREAKFIEEKFTKSTRHYIDFQMIDSAFNRHISILKFVSEIVPPSYAPENCKDEYYTNFVYLLNLGYNSHKLDTDIIIDMAIGKSWNRTYDIRLSTIKEKLLPPRKEYREIFRAIAQKAIDRANEYNLPFTSATKLAKVIEAETTAALPSSLKIAYSEKRLSELIREDFKIGVRKKKTS